MRFVRVFYEGTVHEYTDLSITLLRRDCLLFYVRTTPSFVDLSSLRETSRSLFKVDDVPNRAEVLSERVNELL